MQKKKKKKSGLEQEHLPGTGLSQHTEFYFHCSARTGSDLKAWIALRAQFLEFCPSQGLSEHRVLGQSKLHGFSMLQSCGGCESQLLPRNTRCVPSNPSRNCSISSCSPKGTTSGHRLIFLEGIFRNFSGWLGGREVLSLIPVVCSECRRNQDFFFGTFLHLNSLPWLSESEVKQVIKTEGTFPMPGVHSSPLRRNKDLDKLTLTHSRKRLELFSQRSPRGRLIPINIWRNLFQCLTIHPRAPFGAG